MKQIIIDFLEELHMDYEQLEHGPIMTMAEGDSIARKLNVTACKSLFLCNRQQEYFLLLLPQNKKLAAKSIARQTGSSHLSFGSSEAMQSLLRTSAGAVSLLGLMFDKKNRIRLLADKEILKAEHIGCHPCVNTCSLKIKTTDILNVFLPAIHHENLIVVE